MSKLNCQAPGPVLGPGSGPDQGPESSHIQYSTFIVRISKGRTWRDTIIKQTTPPPTIKLFEADNLIEDFLSLSAPQCSKTLENKGDGIICETHSELRDFFSLSAKNFKFLILDS